MNKRRKNQSISFMLPAQRRLWNHLGRYGDKETPNGHQSEISYFLPLLPKQIKVSNLNERPVYYLIMCARYNDFLLVFLAPIKNRTKEMSKFRNLIKVIDSCLEVLLFHRINLFCRILNKKKTWKIVKLAVLKIIQIWFWCTQTALPTHLRSYANKKIPNYPWRI